jgi:hypothetical protein
MLCGQIIQFKWRRNSISNKLLLIFPFLHSAINF